MIYVDLSCDKISGQQHMQRALRDFVIAQGLFSSKDDAKILVYVQVPFDDKLLTEWKRYKEQGKKIVFIHHYMSKSFYERCAIFKQEELFELINYHVCISKMSELYSYLISRDIQRQNIFIIELAAAEYTDLRKKYFKEPTEKLPSSILFVGRAVKGIDKFVDYANEYNFAHKIICCPDVEKCTKNLSTFTVYTDKCFDSLYKIMSQCQYIYCPSVYNTPPFHLETVLQEAIPCGCIPIVDESYKAILLTDTLQQYGFAKEDSLLKSDLEFTVYQKQLQRFQETMYDTLTQTLNKILIYIKSKI